MKKTTDTFTADAFTRDTFTIDSVDLSMRDLENDMSDESSDDIDAKMRDLENDMSDESSDDSDMGSLLSSFKSLSMVSFTNKPLVDAKVLVKPQAMKNTNRPEFLSPVVPINREAKARVALSNRGVGSAFAKNPKVIASNQVAVKTGVAKVLVKPQAMKNTNSPEFLSPVVPINREAKARVALSNRGVGLAFAKKPKVIDSNQVAALQKTVDSSPKHSEKENRYIVLGENGVSTQANLPDFTRGRQPDIKQGANNSILGKKRSGSSFFKPAAKIFNTGAKTPKVIDSNQVAAFQKIVDSRPKHSEKENRYTVLGENDVFTQANLPSLTRGR